MKHVSVSEYVESVVREFDRNVSKFSYVTETAIAGFQYIDAEIAYQECVADIRGDFYAEDAKEEAKNNGAEKKSSIMETVKKAFHAIIEWFKNIFSDGGPIAKIHQYILSKIANNPKYANVKVTGFYTASEIKKAAEYQGKWLEDKHNRPTTVSLKEAISNFAQLKGLVGTLTKNYGKATSDNLQHDSDTLSQIIANSRAATRMAKASLEAIKKAMSEAKKAAGDKPEKK